VSTRTFYAEFKDLPECFIAVLDLGLERSGELILQAFTQESCWQDGVLHLLASLLVFLDAEPQLARILYVEAMAAGPWALERREQIVAQLQETIVDYWPTWGEEPPGQVTATGTMALLLGLIQNHLVNEEPEPLISLLGPLMGLTVTLLQDEPDVVTREAERARRLAREIEAGDPRWGPPAPSLAPAALAQAEIPAAPANPAAWRSRECLLYIAARGAQGTGPSNREIGAAIGVRHKSQISRLLARLRDDGLITSGTRRAGAANTWLLTERGEAVAQALMSRGETGAEVL
jgi:AcrR family transcriptional regulator